MKFKWESLKNRIKSCVCETVKKIEITHDLDYGKYPIRMHDNIRLSSCRKEPETVTWIESFDKQDVVFDVGANVGAYSLIMSKYAGKVYAFEPSVFTFSVLIKNIHTNRAYNAVPLNIALSEGKKLGTFVYASAAPGGSSHNFDRNLEKEAFRQEIISCSIDEFVEDFKVCPPHHIKLDVDGTEFEILKGAVRTISGRTFKSLMVEAEENDKELFGLLESIGLRKAERYDIGLEGTYNYLFRKKEKV